MKRESERRHVRLDGPFPASFQVRGAREQTTGEATELSAGGMFLAAPSIQPPGTQLEIRILHDRGFVVEGEVVHAAREPIAGMGIRFLPMSELLAQLVLPEPSRVEFEAGTDELEASLGIYRIHYRDRVELRQDYERHLKAGGLQVQTEHVPALGADVELRLDVDGVDVEAVRLRGRVVACLPGGFGVEIGNLQSTWSQLEALAGEG